MLPTLIADLFCGLLEPNVKFKTPLTTVTVVQGSSIYLQSLNLVKIRPKASTLGEHDQCSKLNELAIAHAILVSVCYSVVIQ